MWGRWCRCCPRGTAARPRLPLGPRLGAAGEAARWSETGVAFARLRLRGIETGVAFAGEKWAFLEWFSVAEVMVVSTVAVWGRALVMVVSCWLVSAVAEVLLVSTVAVWGRAVVMVVSQLSRGCVPSVK